MVVRRCSSHILRAAGEVTKAQAFQRRLAWACFYGTSVNSTLPTHLQELYLFTNQNAKNHSTVEP